MLIGQVSVPRRFGGARSCFAEAGALRTTSTRFRRAMPHSQVNSIPVGDNKAEE